MRRTVLYRLVDVLAKSWLAAMSKRRVMWRQPPSAVSLGRSPAERALNRGSRCDYFFADSASIFSITIAVDPPRA